MLAVLLFNLTGYNSFFQYFIQQSDKKLVYQIDSDQYNDAGLVEVKIKINLPYMNDWSGYERYDGEMEYSGVVYKYVKRKVSRDTLYLLCLPNESKTELLKGCNNYTASTNDIANEKGNTNSSLKKNISLSEYKVQSLSYDFAFAQKLLMSYHSLTTPNLPASFIATAYQPPEVNA